MTATYPTPPPPAAPAGPPPPPPPAPRRRGLAALALTGAVVAGGAAGVGGAAAWNAYDDPEPTGGSGASTTPLNVAATGDEDAPDGSVEQVAAAVLPSVVALDVQGPNGAGSGSGVVLSADGLILTNDHVVSLGGASDPADSEVTVSFGDGTTADATVVGTDPLTDVALVQAEGVSGLTPATLGRSANLDVGEQVVAIGSPYGLDATVTSGIVSALDRPVGVARDAEGNTTAYPAIQTDAAINPGNSGGALVDMDGHLVGINASIRTTGSPMGGEAGSIGLGFAIPIDDVRPIIDQLRSGEEPTHARLGIQVSPAPGGVGAAIEEVEAGSAAAEAGLEQGDVITRIDDHRITDSESLVAIVRAYRPGDAVEVTYERSGREEATTLELGSD